ncbi:hypothetical protein [Kitasatospora sp. NPDC058190]|uniref:hypothetical protein n=1 Tax=Kitasatospora sp. NPDC058190 TaxID=3346371 RepID=UPI0036DE4479
MPTTIVATRAHIQKAEAITMTPVRSRWMNEAREHSAQLWASQHHGLLATGGVVLLGAAARALTRGR